MDAEDRRVILDREFDLALTAVLDAFLQQGFFITPTAAGDLHRPRDLTPGRRRYVLIDVAPTGAAPAAPREDSCAATCRVSVFELGRALTVVTFEHGAERVRDVIRILLQTTAQHEC